MIALNTGLRRAELLGLTWDRVDLSRSVLRLEVTKSGKRREVPINDACYRALSSLQLKEGGSVFRTRTIRTAYENAVDEHLRTAVSRLDGLTVISPAETTDPRAQTRAHEVGWGESLVRK